MILWMLILVVKRLEDSVEFVLNGVLKINYELFPFLYICMQYMTGTVAHRSAVVQD